MPSHSKPGGLQTYQIFLKITSAVPANFLCPATLSSPLVLKGNYRFSRAIDSKRLPRALSHKNVEKIFFSSLLQASSSCLNRRRHSYELQNHSSRASELPRTKSLLIGINGARTSIFAVSGVSHSISRRGFGSRTPPCESHSGRCGDGAEASGNRGVCKDSTEEKEGLNSGGNHEFGEHRKYNDLFPKKRPDVLATEPQNNELGNKPFNPDPDHPHISLTEQLRLIRAVRKLEKKLAHAHSDLQRAMAKKPPPRPVSRDSPADIPALSNRDSTPILLSKEDYMNLVDLYFYSHKDRFSPDYPDSSPTPALLDEYSFQLSSDFSKPSNVKPLTEEEQEDISVLKDVEEMLKSRQLREITVMQAFVNLLLDDSSPNRALFEVYRKLPDPGVAYLPRGVVRLFLQRMSTPWVKSERAMLRYLSLIDDMQKANLPITSGEWSSAIYLAGRTFSRVQDSDVAAAFRIWKEMEEQAGVQATNVTFNILFDIAVRAGKFVLGEAVLKEMHSRGLKLNRLGRVSLIFYHGLRGDGDGVRKAYRDFVEAGEIVDTLVLNCVMISLINAQEPIAAEQIYERMKRLQARMLKGKTEDNEDALFLRYSLPGSNMIDREMASNHLGRILVNASRLKNALPEHREELQQLMPLTPDYITFRNLISHHARTSGDLDRLTVLMQEMHELFDLPFNATIFQILFRGFAIHGGSNLPDAKWSNKRLEIVWQACLSAMKNAKSQQPPPLTEVEGAVTVPPMVEGETMPLKEVMSQNRPVRQMTSWQAFITEFVFSPEERVKIQGYRSSESFSSPFFKPDPDPMEEAAAEHDGDDVYTLPAATETVAPLSQPRRETAEVKPTKALVVWLIRAYAKCTGSRIRLEEIWGTIRRLWRPQDLGERDAAIRVLRKALRQCDMRRGM